MIQFNTFCFALLRWDQSFILGIYRVKLKKILLKSNRGITSNLTEQASFVKVVAPGGGGHNTGSQFYIGILVYNTKSSIILL